MAAYVIEIQVAVAIHPEASAEELGGVTDALQGELIQLNVEALERPYWMVPPPNTRAADMPALGVMVVEVTPPVVEAVLTTIADWLGQEDRAIVRAVIGGDAIDLTQDSVGSERQLLEQFIARHAPFEGLVEKLGGVVRHRRVSVETAGRVRLEVVAYLGRNLVGVVPVDGRQQGQRGIQVLLIAPRLEC
jgi:hypothetical protein